MSADEVRRLALEAGIAQRTLQWASEETGVRKAKTGMKSGWEWSLPPKTAKPAEDCQDPGPATFEEFGNLQEFEGGMAEEEL